MVGGVGNRNVVNGVMVVTDFVWVAILLLQALWKGETNNN